MYTNIMDKLELIELLKNTTNNTIDTAMNYATKSIMPQLYADKTDLLIFAVLGFIVLMFYYFSVVRNKSKGD